MLAVWLNQTAKSANIRFELLAARKLRKYSKKNALLAAVGPGGSHRESLRLYRVRVTGPVLQRGYLETFKSKVPTDFKALQFF